MSVKHYQLVAFPIPEHLLYYFSRKLGSEVEELNSITNCTKSVITKRSFYGHRIYESLQESKTFKTEPSNFYLKISNTVRVNHPKLPDGRYIKYDMDAEAYLFIYKHLQQILKTELIAYVDGALFSHERSKGTKKGIVHRAISEFMFKNRILITETTFENLRKMQYRAKKTSKTFVIR